MYGVVSGHSDDCVWNDVVRQCHHKDELIQCTHVYDAPMCKARDDCRYDEALDSPGRCVEADHKYECTYHLKQPKCEGQSECAFHPTPRSQGIAKHVIGKCYPEEDVVCGYLMEAVDCLPEDTGGVCTWDARLGRCRVLLNPEVEVEAEEEPAPPPTCEFNDEREFDTFFDASAEVTAFRVACCVDQDKELDADGNSPYDDCIYETARDCSPTRAAYSKLHNAFHPDRVCKTFPECCQTKKDSSTLKEWASVLQSSTPLYQQCAGAAAGRG